MIHFALRKIFRSGRSSVIGLPHYVVEAMQIKAGDRFAVLYDDERKIVVLQPYLLNSIGPGVNLDGFRVDTLLMP
jgi:hypothetical protein